MTTMTAPTVRRTPTGWLALAPKNEYPHIAVIGDTEQHAREHYEESRRSWLALLDLPAPESASA